MKDNVSFFRSYILLLVITVFGAILRINNFSPFKIYPDSYQSLLVAENIRTYHSVVGYLGTNGMLYPDFFAWTRPGYPLLIDFFNFFINDPTRIAQIISLIAGILAIPLAFFFIKNVFLVFPKLLAKEGHQTSSALAGALLLAVSFNHTVWSGFIMTETLGVLGALLFLFILFAKVKDKPSFMYDFLIGIAFSFCLITRYEYVILIFPISFIIFVVLSSPWRRLLSIIAGLFFTISLIATQLFPFQSAFSTILIQLQEMLKIAILGVSIFCVSFFIIRLLSKQYKKNLITWMTRTLMTLIVIFACIILEQLLLGEKFSLFWKDLSSIRNFIGHDIVISVFALFGLLLLLSKKSLQNYGIFLIFSLVSLTLIYYRVNPDMERYLTHLIPFLLIPASYGFITIALLKKRIVLFFFSLLFVLQIVTTYQGLQKQQDASWFRVSYEEKAAREIKRHIKTNDILIVSLPEPYFYNTHLSTQSLTDTYPFLYIDDTLNSKPVVLIVDMGMQENFPIFTKFIINNLENYKTDEFWIKENYHYLDQTIKETRPVTLYQLTLGELKNKIKKSSF